MSSPLLDCTPVVGAAVLGLAVVVWRRRLGDCWAALTRRPDGERTDEDARRERALRAIAEARLRGYARVQGVVVYHLGVAEGFRVAQIRCSTDDQALRVLLRVLE